MYIVSGVEGGAVGITCAGGGGGGGATVVVGRGVTVAGGARGFVVTAGVDVAAVACACVCASTWRFNVLIDFKIS